MSVGIIDVMLLCMRTCKHVAILVTRCKDTDMHNMKCKFWYERFSYQKMAYVLAISWDFFKMANTTLCELSAHESPAHFGLVTPYGKIDLSYHWLGNGLLPDGTKPLPEPMLTSYHIVLWHSTKCNFTASSQTNIWCNKYENYILEITVSSLWVNQQWVNCTQPVAWLVHSVRLGSWRQHLARRNS